ncbi:hypothetical protein [Chitinophaga qingshengii]|uniref:Uncharacterized protein n=1 Tax=Chitinophaga qingshengii TaxID=1569794 RepID=A0ABR7TUD6_9BACT|nr:hypothetical protein [Chitinophaga qingshengii]MBC9933645.1 hypothetical protein [Chitinophaga qingshengii]
MGHEKAPIEQYNSYCLWRAGDSKATKVLEKDGKGGGLRERIAGLYLRKLSTAGVYS